MTMIGRFSTLSDVGICSAGSRVCLESQAADQDFSLELEMFLKGSPYAFRSLLCLSRAICWRRDGAGARSETFLIASCTPPGVVCFGLVG